MQRASGSCSRVAICATFETVSRSCGHSKSARHGQAELVEAFAAELEDVRFALDGALARSDLIEGGDLLSFIDTHWTILGLDAEAIRRLEEYITALPSGETRLLARLLTALAFLLDQLGQKTAGLGLQRRRCARRVSGDAYAVERLRVFGLITMTARRFDEAEAALAEAETIPGTRRTSDFSCSRTAQFYFHTVVTLKQHRE